MVIYGNKKGDICVNNYYNLRGFLVKRKINTQALEVQEDRGALLFT